MTSYILVFFFTLADGRQIRATQDATHLEEYRPVKTLAGCQQVADAREQRMNKLFSLHQEQLIRSVSIKCVPATNAKKVYGLKNMACPSL